MQKNTTVAAVHYDGGNFYDNMKINISESHKRFRHLEKNQKNIKRFKLLNYLSYCYNALLQKSSLSEAMMLTGLRQKWFCNFRDYWINILNGRPLTIIDFHILLHDYRKKIQSYTELNWESPEAHLNNWQNPNQIYATFSATKGRALRPIVGRQLWNKIHKGATILEYGCSLAPFYYCYRLFFNHLDCKWILADLPTFPYHYAKYLYRNDPSVFFHDIADFADPLKTIDNYDVLILTNVLEHLDEPVSIVNYLLDKLSPNGIMLFDYLMSAGKGMDTTKGAVLRNDCLDVISKRIDIIHGKISYDADINLCIGTKK